MNDKVKSSLKPVDIYMRGEKMNHEMVYKKDVVVIGGKPKAAHTVTGSSSFETVKSAIQTGNNVRTFQDIFLAKMTQGEVLKKVVR